MKRERHSPEQVIRKLRDADRLLSEGKGIAALCQALEISEATFHRWPNQYDGMKANERKRSPMINRPPHPTRAIQPPDVCERSARPPNRPVNVSPREHPTVINARQPRRKELFAFKPSRANHACGGYGQSVGPSSK